MFSDAELGIIEFVRNERSKHIRVRILNSGLKVTLPPQATENDAMKFINSIRAKLIQKQEKLETGLQKSNILIDENSKLQTLTFVVEAKSSIRKNIYFALKSSVLTIDFPVGTDCTTTETQQYFWNGISYFLRKEAKRLLPDRTKQLADKHGFKFSEVKIQSSKTRWGSCSSTKSINLSLFLMLLPAHLIDYVILHELCHTREMNHGDKFWAWMDKVTDGKSKGLRAELKKYHMPQ
ncbi:MAG TPA: SprT family zinc-dependent metalloprotease [Paludibacter sp.]|nr:SprT family zinc-dependent metalloprotease [Paludibacter sp.]